MLFSTKSQLLSLFALVNAVTTWCSVDAVPVDATPSDIAPTESQDTDLSGARLPPAPEVFFTVDPSDHKTYKTEIEYGPVRTKYRFIVKYDLERAAAKCEHLYNKYGRDTWAVHFGYQSPTGEVIENAGTVAYADANNRIVSTAVPVPPTETPGKAYIWFYCTNSGGQVIYDSNFGKNWELDVAPSKSIWG
ncbi:hypothetical protein HK102_013549 [Quaeritorhiza haematococci]|nr:hypothetical protein HK102_013549 [Quaeritorhiza haematococci]